MKVIQRPSPSGHFGDRKGGGKPDFLILHYTDTQDMAEAEDFFLARRPHPEGANVSAHYLIDEDGTIYQYVDESKRAHHAGVSYWNGITDMNSYSIGIELVNPGHKYGYRAFPAAQMAAAAELCRDIMARNSIPPQRVLGHSDVAIGRRIDPGELFDWKGLADQGIGVWPVPLKEDFEKAATMDVRAALTAIGYDPDKDLVAVLGAFQRHFHPEIFAAPDKVGTPDPETLARLYHLKNLKLSP
jgi:N-acetylmuramoyl-L-alanine amidase